MKKFSVVFCAVLIFLFASIGVLLLAPGNLLAFTVINEFVIFDEAENLYWMRDANYAMTIGASADGKMTWYEANMLMDSRVYCNIDGWRLPTKDELEGFFSKICQSGEMPLLNFIFAEEGGEYWTSTSYAVTMAIAYMARGSSGTLCDYWEPDDRYPDTKINAIYVIHGYYLDDDSDGVVNIFDKCPNTSQEATVKPNGCMEGDVDNDGDVDGDDLGKFSHNFGR